MLFPVLNIIPIRGQHFLPSPEVLTDLPKYLWGCTKVFYHAMSFVFFFQLLLLQLFGCFCSSQLNQESPPWCITWQAPFFNLNTSLIFGVHKLVLGLLPHKQEVFLPKTLNLKELILSIIFTSFLRAVHQGGLTGCIQVSSVKAIIIVIIKSTSFFFMCP